MIAARAALCAVFLCCAFRAQAQTASGAIEGVVVDSVSVQPLAGATIIVHGTTLGAVTRDSGQFLIRGVPRGTYRLEARLLGYVPQIHTVAVEPHETRTVFFGLSPAPLQQEEIVVTASKHAQTIREIPVSAAVVASQDITRRNNVQLDQTLRYVPGVFVNDDQVNIRGSSGYARGVGSRVMLLIDGVPDLSGDTGEMKLDAVPMAAIDRVEVVKGAGSALYGSSAMGGVVNVITKTPHDDLQLYAKAYAGGYPSPSYGEWAWYGGMRTQSGVDAGFSKKFGALSLLATGGVRNNESYRQNDDYHRWNFYAKAGDDVSPRLSAWAAVNAANDDHGDWIYWQSLDHALLSPDSTTRIYSFKLDATGEVRYFFSPDFFSVTRGGMFRTTVGDNLDPTGPDSAEKLITFANAYSVEQQFTAAAGARSLLTFGAQATGNVVRSNDYGDRSQWDAAAYVQWEKSFSPPVTLTVGARATAARTENNPLLGRIDPKLGAVYAVSPDFTVRASAGSGFREPSVAERYVVTRTSTLLTKPNPDLHYERSWSYEAGMNRLFAIAGMPLALDAALFWNDYWNLIEPEFVYGVPAQIQFQNVTRARIQGVDASVSSSLFGGALSWSLGYTYMSNRDLTADAPLKYRPRHLLYAHVDGAWRDLFGGFDFRYLSAVERVDDSIAAFINPLTGYPVIPDFAQRVPVLESDARVGVNLNGAFSLPLIFTLNIYNIFQYYYVEIPANLAPIRNIVAQIEFVFQ